MPNVFITSNSSKDYIVYYEIWHYTHDGMISDDCSSEILELIDIGNNAWISTLLPHYWSE